MVIKEITPPGEKVQSMFDFWNGGYLHSPLFWKPIDWSFLKDPDWLRRMRC